MQNLQHQDQNFLTQALTEAKKALGLTSPNPMVGAILVKNGKILAKGYHHRAGLPHAEVEALKKAPNPKGATLYVTLEPCCHSNKRTPPCVDAIIQSGIKRVVIGCLDPNPAVRGKGARKLRQAGIKVEVGVLKNECLELNRFYNHWIVTGMPYVILKCATSLDGKIALANGKSKWITSEASRKKVHELRSQVDGILAGIGTVKADNPQLTARHAKAKKQPVRIVLDPNLETPLGAQILKLREHESCWLISSRQSLQNKSQHHKIQKLEQLGVEIITCPQLKSKLKSAPFNLKALLKILGQRGLTSLIVEGGPGTWTSFIQQDCYQELQIFMAPIILGGDAKSLFNDLNFKSLSKKPQLKFQQIKANGPDRLAILRKSLYA